MALTRKFLSALKVEDDVANEIINAHVETVNDVKSELEDYKAKYEKLADIEKKLTKVQKEYDTLKAQQDDSQQDEYKDKYEALEKEFKDYKQSIKDKEIKETKIKAYKELLKESKISEKRFDAITKLSDDAINKIEFEEDGSIKNKEDVLKSIADDWSEYVQTTETLGASTATPPANNGGSDKKISRAQQIAQRYHDDLYGKIKED